MRVQLLVIGVRELVVNDLGQHAFLPRQTVDQEVQFRFDNGVWNAHQRKRGVEMTVEGRTPRNFKITPNHHYSAAFVEPWGDRVERGYGIEVLRRFFEEVAFVEFGGPQDQRGQR